MGTILNSQELNKLSELKRAGRKVVLVGGCFDILHTGHIEFLKSAKKIGNILVVMLESDRKVSNLKGKNRPANSQKDRAAVLSNLPFVDYVIRLIYLPKDNDYEMLVKLLKPDIIAVTVGGHVFEWEKTYMNSIGGKIVEVIPRIDEYSTTEILRSAKITK